MSYVKASEVTFQYPVLAFMRDGYVSGFSDLHNLTQVVPLALKAGKHDGMELIDSSETRWVVRSIEKTSRATRWGLLGILLYMPPNWRVEYELEQLPSIPFGDIQDRAIASERAFTFGEYEAHGEEAQFEALMATIRNTRNVAELFESLSLDEVQFI